LGRFETDRRPSQGTERNPWIPLPILQPEWVPKNQSLPQNARVRRPQRYLSGFYLLMSYSKNFNDPLGTNQEEQDWPKPHTSVISTKGPPKTPPNKPGPNFAKSSLTPKTASNATCFGNFLGSLPNLSTFFLGTASATPSSSSNDEEAALGPYDAGIYSPDDAMTKDEFGFLITNFNISNGIAKSLKPQSITMGDLENMSALLMLLCRV
jgi:hypothetical protein